MSKARQSKRQRYRKPRADYQAGGRVNARRGGIRFDELDAIMPNVQQRRLTGKTSTEKVKPINARPNFKKTNPTTPRPNETLEQYQARQPQQDPNAVQKNIQVFVQRARNSLA